MGPFHAQHMSNVHGDGTLIISQEVVEGEINVQAVGLGFGFWLEGTMEDKVNRIIFAAYVSYLGIHKTGSKQYAATVR